MANDINRDCPKICVAYCPSIARSHCVSLLISVAMAKEAKKEAFRKYLESSGVLDALTKVLVALYEENEKPSAAIEFIQHSLGGPTLSEYEKLQSEKAELQLKYDELSATHQHTCRELEKLKKEAASTET